MLPSKKAKLSHSTNARRGKHLSPLYIRLTLHANSTQKEAIAIFHALGVSVSYDRIMDVRRDFTKAVSMQWAADGLVIPTHVMRGIFVTSAVDNIDEPGRYKFHGTAMTITSHPNQDNMGEDPPPLDYNAPQRTSVELPVDFEFAPYLDEYAGDITLLVALETVQPSFPDGYINGVNDEAWLKHVHKGLAEKQGELRDIPVTYSGFFSHCQGSDDVRQRATVGVFPGFFVLRKSSINGNAKTCNAYVEKRQQAS